MAAVTIASGPSWNTRGAKRSVSATLTAPANDDTWVTGLTAVERVEISFPAGNLAAADAVSYTVSGGTVTFKVVGTARNLAVEAIGY